ncbi:TetR/AcrR family transcriptional regulator [Yoonia sediminilitoris]|uniref:TetR family transcriptional regulator n=1 Tax=Yoonia sediminilitoris TaxID=1286148 RepID=A0A2T6K6K0_9RHOB|nr:TetR/AcrR family transcriptional regulator [Yoonia sediminilitoris]PUB10270.1 TetR family transcriptional regulator [Yoonia sediminilitoris]RCW89778.1 TetR family transcriptional regulator [Yoonia sediminilitoris]
MDKLSLKLNDRVKRKSKKREDKRRQLAESAAHALCTLGYANTTLRDIAEHSGNALGTLHYYFEDRVDLITFSVKMYKSAFLDELRTAANASETLAEAIANLSAGLSHGVSFNADEHKLWFDIRNQAIFDEVFEDSIAEIEGEIIKIFAEIEQRFLVGRDAAILDYAAIDGLFRYLMQSKLPEHRNYDANLATFQKMLNYLWVK